jgi:hypothetical protein
MSLVFAASFEGSGLALSGQPFRDIFLEWFQSACRGVPARKFVARIVLDQSRARRGEDFIAGSACEPAPCARRDPDLRCAVALYKTCI